MEEPTGLPDPAREARMRTLSAFTLALALALGLASAQETPQTIDLEMVAIAIWHVVEIDWAGDEPLTGETGTFDGRCSVPSDYFARGSSEGMTFPTGPFTSETEHCGQLVWEEDDDGRPVVVGRLGTDGFMTLYGEDGSVMTTTFVADETGFDPVMGLYHYGLRFEIESMTGMEELGLTFVSGSYAMHFVLEDIEALLTESVPAIGVAQGSATFVVEAAGVAEDVGAIEFEMVNVNQYRVTDVRWAGDEPFSGATSTFDGRCSIPSEYVRTGALDGLTFPIGHGWGTTEQCGRFVWETDAEGRRVIRGNLTSDGIATLESDDGSTMAMSYDATSTYDPVMGLVIYSMAVRIDDMTSPPGLSFVDGRMEATYTVSDFEALMSGAIEIVGVVHGVATFAPLATD